jgi:hypothetical protein
MAPMRKRHDDERVSNERLNALAYAGKSENLALTRDDDGLLMLRFHTAGGPGRVTDRGNNALVITGTGDLVRRPDRRANPR